MPFNPASLPRKVHEICKLAHSPASFFISITPKDKAGRSKPVSRKLITDAIKGDVDAFRKELEGDKDGFRLNRARRQKRGPIRQSDRGSF